MFCVPNFINIPIFFIFSVFIYNNYNCAEITIMEIFREIKETKILIVVDNLTQL